MGRNKFSQTEINEISRLLALKNAANRAGQKLIRHDLRTKYEFNISDFNEQGKAFGPEELEQAIKRNAIIILDDKTIAAMKEKRARDRARDEEKRKQEMAVTSDNDGQTDWQEVLKEWNAWEKSQGTSQN